MKYIFIGLLVIFNPISSLAQKDNLFADVGSTGGFSVTYNHKTREGFGMGGGLQGYNFSLTKYDSHQFLPGVFGDLRFYRPRKKHLFFYLIDLGINVYTFNSIYTAYKIITAKNNGLYFGFGAGYLRTITKRGGGPYASLKFISNGYTADEYYIPTGTHSKFFGIDGTLALSVGFKF